MDACRELHERAKEFVRQLCSRNLIPGADLNRLTVAVHDELCSSSLAILADVSLQKDFSCRGNMEIAVRAIGHDLMVHLIAREKVKDKEMEADPVIRTQIKVREPEVEVLYSDPTI